MSTSTSVRRAVDEYEKADKELQEFLDENEDLFQIFNRLVEDRNVRCEKARNMVKRHETSSGDFLYSTARKYIFNVPMIKERVSRSVFDRITRVSVDRKAVDILLERGDIEEGALEGAFEVNTTRKCSGPKPWSITG